MSEGVSAVALQYNLTRTEELVTDRINLRHMKSNLPGHTGGYWVFVCPVTGNPCRVLYLHNGHFVSRKALPKGVIYKCQSYAGTYRAMNLAFDYSEAVSKLNEATLKPNWKELYRGKPTRATRRLMKKEDRYEQALKGWLSQQRRGR